jgi:hypothetical protein
LDGRAKKCVVTDAYRANVEDDTVEIEIHLSAQFNIKPIITPERGLDLDSIAPLAEELREDLSAKRMI